MSEEFFAIDINAVVKDVVEITRPKWKDEAQVKGIPLEVVCHFGEIRTAKGNASELREAILNIVLNAIEAMPMGGHLDVRTFSREDRICIQISDTGVGMTEDVKRKIFEPFFTTKPFTNTGLGLSMTYGIVKRFGGEIEVRSEPGQGTTFLVTLPEWREGKDEALTATFSRAVKEARILVIDDEEAVRNALSRILRHLNYEVTVAKNGGEGLRLFKEKEFDVVLTDLAMPGMSGWDVCKAIKKTKSTVPVGMITGWGMEIDETKKEEYGLDFVISKPFDFHEIWKAIDETIGSRQNASAQSQG